jgi:Ca2+-transporting ATPase
MLMAGRWYALTLQETVERLKSDSKKGLPEKEVKERLERYGPNQLAGSTRGFFVAAFLKPV